MDKYYTATLSPGLFDFSINLKYRKAMLIKHRPESLKAALHPRIARNLFSRFAYFE